MALTEELQGMQPPGGSHLVSYTREGRPLPSSQGCPVSELSGPRAAGRPRRRLVRRSRVGGLWGGGQTPAPERKGPAGAHDTFAPQIHTRGHKASRAGKALERSWSRAPPEGTEVTPRVRSYSGTQGPAGTQDTERGAPPVQSEAGAWDPRLAIPGPGPEASVEPTSHLGTLAVRAPRGCVASSAGVPSSPGPAITAPTNLRHGGLDSVPGPRARPGPAPSCVGRQAC